MKPKNRIKDRFYTQFMKRYRSVPFYIPFFNNFLRSALRAHLLFLKVITSICLKGKEKEMEDWYKNKKIFFGLAIIRSGTVFLSNLLNDSVPKLAARHEARVDDYWSYPKAFQSEEMALKYIETVQKKEIYCKMKNIDIDFYGEINPFLRRHCEALQKTYPDARFFHLVRDGRDVIRSIMCRATFDIKDPLQNLIHPKEDGPYAKRWGSMTRFERVCWLWQEDNKYLREHIKYTVRFENLISDYSYFKEKLSDYLGIYISEDVWESYVNKPKNESPEYSFPRWEKWTPEQRRQFIDICGEEMKKCGYDVQ